MVLSLQDASWVAHWVYLHMVWLILEFTQTSEAFWVQAYEVFFSVNNCLVFSTWLLPFVWSALLPWVFLLIVKTSDLLAWLMTCLALLGIFLPSLWFANINPSAIVSAKLRSILPSTSITLKLRACVVLLCMHGRVHMFQAHSYQKSCRHQN